MEILAQTAGYARQVSLSFVAMLHRDTLGVLWGDAGATRGFYRMVVTLMLSLILGAFWGAMVDFGFGHDKDFKRGVALLGLLTLPVFWLLLPFSLVGDGATEEEFEEAVGLAGCAVLICGGAMLLAL